MIKIFIVSENIKLENNGKWIIDTFQDEFIKYTKKCEIVYDINKADIIWMLTFNIDAIKKIQQMEKKYVITTIHHIDNEKMNEFMVTLNLFETVTNKYHVICNKVYYDLRDLTNKSIIISNFWINELNFFKIINKEGLYKKYGLEHKKYYYVGSFQRDTEGKINCMKPKLSKGPDIFCNIVDDMRKRGMNPFVILAGRRRGYIIRCLNDLHIPYKYFEMVTNEELNELYNLLDLYIVSSRVEGGPRAIMECGLSKTPIISTNVGVSEYILQDESIYDMNNYLTYRNAKINVETAFENTNKYTISNYMDTFTLIFNLY